MSKPMADFGERAISLILLCAVMLIIAGMQCNGTTEPPTSPISPVEILPVKPAVLTAFYALDVHWDDPTVSEGYATVHCLNLPEAHLQIEWKVTDNTGLMVASGSEPVDFEPPTEPGTGIAAGPIAIQADLEPGEYTVWHRLRWILVDAECIDAVGEPITEITPGVFVPAEGDATHQDAEGYWYTVERNVPPEPTIIYLPLISKGWVE